MGNTEKKDTNIILKKEDILEIEVAGYKQKEIHNSIALMNQLNINSTNEIEIFKQKIKNNENERKIRIQEIKNKQKLLEDEKESFKEIRKSIMKKYKIDENLDWGVDPLTGEVKIVNDLN